MQKVGLWISMTSSQEDGDGNKCLRSSLDEWLKRNRRTGLLPLKYRSVISEMYIHLQRCLESVSCINFSLSKFLCIVKKGCRAKYRDSVWSVPLKVYHTQLGNGITLFHTGSNLSGSLTFASISSGIITKYLNIVCLHVCTHSFNFINSKSHTNIMSSYYVAFYFWNPGFPLQWRHNGGDCVSNHQPHDRLLNRLFRRRSKETWKAPRHWPLCGEFNGDR